MELVKKESSVDVSTNGRDIKAVKPPAIPIKFASIYVPFIGSIDTKNNTFNARVDIDLMWPATDSDVEAFMKDENK